MKKVILAVMAMGTAGFAQDKAEKSVELRPRMTAEQRAELQSKKMTLELDLNAKQQKELNVLLLKEVKQRDAKRAEMMAKPREKGKKLSADERFEKHSTLLDKQIAHRDEMKKILTPVQMEKWETLKKERTRETRKKVHFNHKKRENKQVKMHKTDKEVKKAE